MKHMKHGICKYETPYLQHMKYYQATHETSLSNIDLVYETLLMQHMNTTYATHI
jgi:hypothetical protein